MSRQRLVLKDKPSGPEIIAGFCFQIYFGLPASPLPTLQQGGLIFNSRSWSRDYCWFLFLDLSWATRIPPSRSFEGWVMNFVLAQLASEEMKMDGLITLYIQFTFCIRNIRSLSHSDKKCLNSQASAQVAFCLCDSNCHCQA